MAIAKTKKRNSVAKRSETPVRPPQAATETEVAEVMATSIPVKAVGICSTCRHQARCLFFKAARQAIHTCEEFDDVNQPGDLEASKAIRPANANNGISTGQGKPAGLCTNCDTRLTCMHREPGVMVQECEEYR